MSINFDWMLTRSRTLRLARRRRSRSASAVRDSGVAAAGEAPSCAFGGADIAVLSLAHREGNLSAESDPYNLQRFLEAQDGEYCDGIGEGRTFEMLTAE